MGTMIQAPVQRPAVCPPAFGQARKADGAQLPIQFGQSVQSQAPAGRKQELYANGGRKLLAALGLGIGALFMGRVATNQLMATGKTLVPLALAAVGTGLASDVLGIWGLVNLFRGAIAKN